MLKHQDSMVHRKNEALLGLLKYCLLSHQELETFCSLLRTHPRYPNKVQDMENLWPTMCGHLRCNERLELLQPHLHYWLRLLLLLFSKLVGLWLTYIKSIANCRMKN